MSTPRLTQEDLSARVEAYGVILGKTAIAKIERASRSVLDFELRALAAALSVSVGWLVDEESANSEENPPMRQFRPRRL